MLNPFQRACADVYGGGDFAHVDSIEGARQVGDTLFTFLMIELASSEGCDGLEEAERRLESAIADINSVAAAVQRRASSPGTRLGGPAMSDELQGLDAQPCRGLVLNVPDIFADVAFQQWVESDPPKFTWHHGGPPHEWSDVVVLVDPDLSGEGSDSDMPTPIWDRIVDACRQHLGADASQVCHYMVRLTNLVT